MTPRDRLYVRFQHYTVSIYLSIPLLTAPTWRHGHQNVLPKRPPVYPLLFAKASQGENYEDVLFFAQCAVFTVQYTPIAKNHEQHSLNMCHVANALIFGDKLLP